MATVKLREDTGNSLMCSLCLSQFKSPRLLPCFHTFCEDCLSAYISSQTKDSKTFNCPLCKVVISSPDETNAVDKWATCFPLNDFIIHVTDGCKKSTTGNKLCDPCIRTDESNTATFWCEQCREKLCTMCQKYHSKIKSLSAHSTVPLDSLTEVMELKMELPEVTCPHHVGKDIEVFCLDHQTLCCTVCLLHDHRKCIDIETLDNMVAKFGLRNNEKNILGGFDKMKDQILKIVEENEKNKTTMNEESNQILMDIDCAAEEAKSKIDTLRDNLKESCCVILTKHTAALYEASNSATKFLCNIETCRNLMEVVLRHGSKKHLFVLYERFSKQLKTHFSQMESEISEQKGITLVFKKEDPDSRLISMGTVDASTSQTEKVIPDVLYRVNKVVERMNRKFLSDGQTAQVPMIHLLLLDQNLKFTKEIELSTCPTDLARGDTEDEIYVAGRSPSKILCLDAQRDFKVKRTIKVKGDLCGLDYNRGNIFAAIDQFEVKMMSPEGRVAATLPSSAGHMRYVGISRKLGMLYQTEEDEVVCKGMPLEDKEEFRYANHSLTASKGLCFDTKGNVYVCGNASQNVHQISSDGKKSRILIEKLQQTRNPWGVVYNPEKNSLLVLSERNAYGVAFELYKFKFQRIPLPPKSSSVLDGGHIVSPQYEVVEL